MFNKTFTICSSVFLIFAFMSPGYADEHFPFLAEVSKESVNVRAGPNTNFEKVDKLDKGSQVVVLGRSFEWLKVQPMPTTKAYIRSDYLTVKEGQDIAEVSGDNVNVRCRASSDAASLGEVKKGTLVKVIGQVTEAGEAQKAASPGWCRLLPVAGTAVWIHQDFLKEVSADVPVSSLIPEVQWSSAVVTPTVKWQSVPVAQFPPKREVVETVSLQGKLQALPQAAGDDVHYEIIIDDKNTYYLKDFPQISRFVDALVAVEGTVISDPSSHAQDSPSSQKKSMYPLVQINKIALVL